MPADDRPIRPHAVEESEDDEFYEVPEGEHDTHPASDSSEDEVADEQNEGLDAAGLVLDPSRVEIQETVSQMADSAENEVAAENEERISVERESEEAGLQEQETREVDLQKQVETARQVQEQQGKTHEAQVTEPSNEMTWDQTASWDNWGESNIEGMGQENGRPNEAELATEITAPISRSNETPEKQQEPPNPPPIHQMQTDLVWPESMSRPAPVSTEPTPTSWDAVAVPSTSTVSNTADNNTANSWDNAPSSWDQVPVPQNTRDARSLFDDFGQPEPQEQSQTEDAWSSWGGWFSSAAKSVTSVIEKTDIGKVVQNISKTAVAGLDKVYETLDPDFKEMNIRETQQQNTMTREPDASSVNANNHVNQSSTQLEGNQEASHSPTLAKVGQEATEVVLGTIDKTFDTFSDLLGNTLLSAYRKTQDMQLSSKLGAVRESTPIVKDTEKIAGKGLEILEGLGRAVGGVVAEKIISLNKNTSFVNDGPATGLRKAFEDTGAGHSQALEMLSQEARLKVSTLSGSDAHQPVTLQALNNVLNTEAIRLESTKRAEDKFYKSLSDPQVQGQVMFLLDRIGVSGSGPRLKAIGAGWDIRESNNLSDFYTLFTLQMANNLSKALEQILRISEVLLIRVAETKNNYLAVDEMMQTVEYAKVVRRFAEAFVGDLWWFRSKCFDTLEKIKLLQSLSIESETVEQEAQRVKGAIQTDTEYALQKFNSGVSSCRDILILLDVTVHSQSKRQD